MDNTTPSRAVVANLKTLRQRAGYRMRKLRTCGAIMALPAVHDAGPTLDDRLAAAEALLLEAVASLAESDRLVAEAMLALGPHSQPTLAARLRSLGGSVETSRDHMDSVTDELALRLYNLGNRRPPGARRDGGPDTQTHLPAGAKPAPTDSATPHTKVSPLRPTEAPTVFAAFSDLDGYDMRYLTDALRNAEVEVIAFPLEAKQKGQQLINHVTGHSSTNKVLLIAVSPNALRDHQFSKLLSQVLLPTLTPLLKSTMVVSLKPIESRNLPAYLKPFQLIATDRVVATLGGEPPPDPPPSDDPYETVSGAFEIARPLTDMLTELKNQIYFEPYKMDQKYLYWDVRAASRWQTIAASSQYATAQLGTNVLVRHADELIALVLSASASTSFSFINFGVGTGVKDGLILDALLKQSLARDPSTRVAYFPVDESLSMIQITIQSLQDRIALYRHNLDVHFVLDDFVHIDRFAKYIRDTEQTIFKGAIPTRILGFFGSSLGNFQEINILGKMRQLMTPGSFLLVGVEFIAGRTERPLRQNYEDDHMKGFLVGPIADVEGELPRGRLEYSVHEEDPTYTDVPGAQTIVGRLHHHGHPVELFYSTKYEQNAFKEFLVRQGFTIHKEVVSDHNPPLYGKYLLSTDARASSAVRV